MVLVKQHPTLQQTVIKLTVVINFILFGLTNSSHLMAGNNGKNKSEIHLLSTFYKEVNKENKTVLKLYDNNTYEYIQFIVKRKQPVAKRETGTYKWKNKKLVLRPRSGKKSKYHNGKFYYDETIGLQERKNAESSEAILVLSNDERFKAPYYTDSIFGIVSNDAKVANKLRDYKYLPKPEHHPIPEVEMVTLKEPEPITNVEVEEESTDLYNYSSSSKVNLSKAILKKLKAIIVVGADEFNGNKEFIKEQKEVAVYLKNLGVEVKEFYYPNSKWADIKKGTEGANIFIYSGHGITVGETDLQGTIYINEGIIEGPELTMGLKLHKNALVIFNHACYSAGASIDDKKDIGIKLATQRVEDYAEPFINLNAGCYYANNYSGCVQPFLTDFFNGMPVSKIYKKYANQWNKVELIKKHKTNPSYETGISGRKPEGNGYTTIYTMNADGKLVEEKIKEFKSYDIAYVGLPNYSIKDIFK